MFVKFVTTRNEDLIINTDKVFVISGTKQDNVFRIFVDNGDYYDVRLDKDTLSMRLRFLNDDATVRSNDRLKI